MCNNEEAVENTVDDKEVEGGIFAEAISKGLCSGAVSGAVVSETDITTSINSELESTVDSMSKDIAKNLAEHYTELTQYAVLMSEIIETLNNKVELQSEAYQEQKMDENCYLSETHEPMNCLGSVHQFVQCLRDYTQTVFDSLGGDEEADASVDDDDSL